MAAQTALTNAQAEKVRSETTAQKVENMVGIGIELAKKVAEVRKNKKDTEEVEQKIENLKKTAEATEESIKLIKANGRPASSSRSEPEPTARARVLLILIKDVLGTEDNILVLEAPLSAEVI